MLMRLSAWLVLATMTYFSPQEQNVVMMDMVANRKRIRLVFFMRDIFRNC